MVEKKMITEHDVKWQWEHRSELINIADHFCDEKEVEYIIEVLGYLRIPRGDCYLSDYRIIEEILEAHERGVVSPDCADQLMKENEIIGEYA